jgi:hypothetical protein
LTTTLFGLPDGLFGFSCANFGASDFSGSLAGDDTSGFVSGF